MKQTKIYSEALADQLLGLIRSGKTLAAACREADVEVDNAYRWKSRNYDKFGDRLHHATQDRACAWADEIVEIADDCPCRDIDIRRAALKIKTRQWLIEKCHPATFAAVPKVAIEDEMMPVVSPVDFLKTWKSQHPITQKTAAA